MLADGVDINLIKKYSGLTQEQIEKNEITNRIKKEKNQVGWLEHPGNRAYRNNNRHIVLVPSGFKGFELPDHSVLTTDTSRFWAAPQN